MKQGKSWHIVFRHVLDRDNRVQTRRVTTGSLQEDGLRVIESGLKPDDWVVVGGLPRSARAWRSSRSGFPRCRPYLNRPR